MSYERHITTGFTVFLLTLCAGLLIGRLEGARFAGGAGKTPVISAFVNETPYQRGERVTATEWTTLSIGEHRVYMDKNTTVELVSLSSVEPVIRIIEGRVVINGALAVQTRETRLIVNGTSSLVHYSWLDEFDLGIISGSATLETPTKTLQIEEMGQKFSTVAPYTTTEIDFLPEQSSAKAFYAWVASVSLPPLESTP